MNDSSQMRKCMNFFFSYAFLWTLQEER